MLTMPVHTCEPQPPRAVYIWQVWLFMGEGGKYWFPRWFNADRDGGISYVCSDKHCVELEINYEVISSM